MKAELRVVTLRETESDINSNNKSTWKHSKTSEYVVIRDHDDQKKCFKPNRDIS